MDTKEQITAYCRKFRTAGISKQLELLVKQAENEAVGFMQFTLLLLRAEAEHRHHNDVNRRRKVARLPSNNDLDRYDKSFDNGVPKNRLI
jgi:DNA replication protein DnaC